MTDSKRIVASVFSGAGGFDWGFHRAGFETRLAVELKESPAATLAHNLDLKTLTAPISPTLHDLPAVIQGDVRTVDFSALTSMQPDVLIGGPPCQDFSISKGSKREGLNGGRGTLYLDFLRALMFLQPKMFVFENVPGFTSANSGQAYRTVLDDLQNLDTHRREAIDAAQPIKVPHEAVNGYEILFKDVVDAPMIGVSQTRRRLIIVGIRSDLASSFGGLTNSLRDQLRDVLTGSMWHFDRYPLTPIEIFEGQPLHRLRGKYRQVMRAYHDLGKEKPFPKADDWHREVYAHLAFDVIKDYYAALGLDYTKDHDRKSFRAAMAEHEQLLQQLGWLGKPVYDLKDNHNTRPKQSKDVQARMAQIPPEKNAEFVDGTEWCVTSKEISFIYRRPSPLKPAWTVMAYGGGGTYGYHYERDRQMLTLRERARIQTFSDDFEFQGTDVRAQIGEAVPPLLGERIACAVKQILDLVDQYPLPITDIPLQVHEMATVPEQL
ncbi:MAG: DNA cytosine methyltransferase [Anaerolineae bacterium]|nr:DNA cytosine methyltransferase [Anaerolineae bacterium]NUQ04671.1 DNA cytosine methyltransferase [Anaerolineae bacterium]